MAEITKELGRIPVSRGDYQATVEYYKDNIVQYKRGSYQVVSESPIVGVPPTNDKNIVNPGWTLFAGTLDAQDIVNQIKEQETKSIQAVAAREAEILAKSDASEVSFNNTGTSISETNVQDALKKTDGKLTELELKTDQQFSQLEQDITYTKLYLAINREGINITNSINLKLGFIEKDGTITKSLTWKYGVVFVPKGATLNVSAESIMGYPRLGVASNQNVDIGDSVTVVSGDSYTATDDTYIVISVGIQLNQATLTTDDTIYSRGDNTPTEDSQNFVKSGGVKAILNEIENDLSSIDKSFITIPANYKLNKTLKASGSTVPYNTTEQDANGYIISLMIPARYGQQFKWYHGINVDKGGAFAIFDSSNDCNYYYYAYSSQNGVLQIQISNHSTQYVIASFYVADNYDCKITEIVNGEEILIWKPESAQKVLNLPSQDVISGTKIFIGNLSAISPIISGTPESSSIYATMDSTVFVPYRGVTLHFKLPELLYAGIVTGTSGIATPVIKTGIENGDDYQLPDSAALYRLYFYNKDGSNIDVSAIQAMVENGDINIYFDDNQSIMFDNAEINKYIQALMYRVYVGREVMNNNYVPNMPVFVHISDIHGDAERLQRCMEFCDKIGATACLCSGDIVNFNITNGAGFCDYIEDKAKTPLFMCIGNHDSYSANGVQNQYNMILKHSMLKNSVQVPSVSSVIYPTYYYKDFTVQQIRLITLNQWDSTNDVYYTQEQADFFVNALLTTPANYGVIVMSHSPEGKPSQIQSHTKFYQEVNPGGFAFATFGGVDFMREILDAFITKGTLIKTYSKEGFSDVVINANFSSVADGVEFIAQVTGHEHSDWIGNTKNSANRMLMLNITTGAAIYGLGAAQAEWAEDGDLPRGGRGSTQDAFNVYVIDRENHCIRIARVGSNISSYNLTLRDSDIIPYSI